MNLIPKCRHIYLAVVSSLSALGAQAESCPPSVLQWQKIYGGTNDDYAYSVRQAADRGYLVAGVSWSGISGNKQTTNYGRSDGWVLRLDAVGDLVWERDFGGTSVDELWGLAVTRDGGCIVVGQSSSAPSGNKNSPSWGGGDYWVIRLDGAGNVVWEKTFGGNDIDRAHAVQETPDGGFLVGGWSNSGASGNKALPLYRPEGDFSNASDMWLLRLDSEGVIVWQKAYGGYRTDTLFVIQPRPDGTYLLAGSSDSSFTGNKETTNYLGADVWILAINSDGEKLWERCYGGDRDDQAYHLALTSDGGFAVGAMTASGVSGNKTTPTAGGGWWDYWLLRCDSSGEILWEQTFGGTGHEMPAGLYQTVDGGFVIGGLSSSGTNGNKIAVKRSASDAWIIRLDGAGNRIWEETYPGLYPTQPYSLQPTRDGGFVVAGGAESVAGSFYDNVVVLKFAPDALMMPRIRVLAPIGNAVNLELVGPASKQCVIEFTHDLVNWGPLSTNVLSDVPTVVLDSYAPPGQRFYRAVLIP